MQYEIKAFILPREALKEMEELAEHLNLTESQLINMLIEKMYKAMKNKQERGLK